MDTPHAERDYQRHVLYHYNRFAHLYDINEWIRSSTRQKAVHLSGWKPGERVLDLCTGTGTLARVFAEQGAHVVGVDLARGMLKRASLKTKHMNTSWSEMDATQLAFPDRAFEVSVLSLALHHMPVAEQLCVLNELRRVTSRCVVIIEPDIPVKPRWIPLWVFVANVIDESEYMHEWVRQDFPATCHVAGLRVNAIHGSSFGLHRILLCDPAHENLSFDAQPQLVTAEAQ